MKSPFKFLDSYTREDRDIFFGREQEIKELYRRLFESKILLVYGISGTGKSSLIHCGLANKIQESDWLPINIRRGGDIVSSMGSAIQKACMSPLKEMPSTPIQFNKAVRSLYLDYYKIVFFIFDQFEELFIFGSREEKNALIQVIKSLADSDLQCRFIFIMREEYLAGITELEKIIPDFLDNRIRIELMSFSNAREAITGPCKVFNIELEEGFTDELLERLSPDGREVELTYLQVFLDKIFRLADESLPSVEADGNTLKFNKELLQRAGNVSDLLGSFLDEQIAQLTDPDSALAVLKSFVSVKGTKRQMSQEEVQEYALTLGKPIDAEPLRQLIQTFVQLRILRDKDQNGRYELRHDALAEKIYEKITLVEKELLEIRQLIENAYNNWQKRGVLLSKEDLEYIAPYESRLHLSKEQTGLIEKSKIDLVRVKIRRRNIVVVASITLLVVFAGFTIWASIERNKAFAQSRRSKILLLIANAREASLSNPTKAIRYAQLAYKKDSTNYLVTQTLSDIFYQADSKPFYAVSVGHSENVNSAVFSPDGKYILTASGDKTAKLWDLSGKCLVTLTGHSEDVRSAVFSSDGKSILTASMDKTAKLWDLSGKCMVTLTGHSGPVNSAVFSPDGKSILTTSVDSTAKLWDLSGKCLLTLSGHRRPVISAVFSPDRKYVLTASIDKTAKLWDLSGNCRVTLSGHTDGVSSAVFSPDGKSILTASWDKTAKLWDLSGKCMVTLSGHTEGVWSSVFSPNGKSILTASSDNTAKLWDLSGKCMVTLSGHSDFVCSAIFSSDGKSILTASWDKTAKLWDLTGKCLATLSGHSDVVNSALFSLDDKSILTVSVDKTAKLWDLSRKCPVTLSGNSEDVNSAVFSPDGKSILASSSDKTAKLWDLSGKCLLTLSGHSGPVISAVFSPDGKSILTTSVDSTAKLWDLSGKCLITLSGHSGPLTSAVFSPDSKYILTASWDSTAKLWDLSGKCLVTLSGHLSFVFSAVFSPDGRSILTASRDKSAKLWDLSGKCLVTFLGHRDRVNSAIFSSDAKLILTTSNDKTAKLWNLTGKCMVTLSGHSDWVKSAAFSPDDKLILTASMDNTAKLWDLTGKCLVTLSGHLSFVFSVVISADGKYILTASGDKTAKLWDLSGKCLLTLSGHSDFVFSAVFSPDGNYILTASFDKTSKLWFTPSFICNWLSTAKIGLLSPADKVEIDELDDFGVIMKSDKLSLIKEYADWYLKTQDTLKAISLYRRALELNPMSIDKKILGDIYRKQNKKDE